MQFEFTTIFQEAPKGGAVLFAMDVRASTAPRIVAAPAPSRVMRQDMWPKIVVLIATLLCSSAAPAQLSNPYGSPISLEAAKRATAAAVTKARENNWLVAVAVVDPSGNLVHFEKMDGTQNGSSLVAIDKARTSALFKRPTKAFQDALAAGGEGLRILQLQGVVPIDGGVPLIMDGRIVGAIGVSGVTSAQDGVCAQAGASILR